jgi:tryptophanyl-tRNA synthetase
MKFRPEVLVGTFPPVSFATPSRKLRTFTAFKATIVPVGEDQAPLIEQTNEIVRRLNRQIGRNLLPEAVALIPRVGRLPSVDGKSKMSKSQGNAIPLSASPDEIRDAVRMMYTDPHHLRANDPGRVEGNVVFTYLDAFDEDRESVEDLKARYQEGGVGDVTVKRRLEDALQALLAPIRARRARLGRDPAYITSVLRAGTVKARERTQTTLDELRNALGLFALD